MARLSMRAGKNRLAILGGLLAAFAAAWFGFSHNAADLIEVSRAEARVVEIIERRTDPLEGNRLGPVIALVELPDGGRARVIAQRASLAIGGIVEVTVNRYSDGTRTIRAAAPDTGE